MRFKTSLSPWTGSKSQACRRFFSASTTSPTPPRLSIPRRSSPPRFSAWTGWENGRRRLPGWARATRSNRFGKSIFRILLGFLYSAFTYYTGFRVNSGEYKVMGLAPYGKPKYVKAIYDNLIDLKEDGTFRLKIDYFNYCTGLTMTNGKFDDLFGGPPRKARDFADSTGHGSGPFDPGSDRRSRAPSGEKPPSRDRRRKPLSGGRRCFKLCGQWKNPPGRAVQGALDPALCRGCRRRRGRGAHRLAPTGEQAPESRRNERYHARELFGSLLYQRRDRTVSPRQRSSL